MEEMISRWPQLWYINQYTASPDFVVNIVIYNLKLYKII